MRLGDLDALEKRMKKRLNFLLEAYSEYDEYTRGFDEGCVAVKNAPTIDPATLRPHGEWIKRCITSVDSPDVSECSICKYPVSTMWGKTNYCPNCGADMRGENNA